MRRTICLCVLFCLSVSCGGRTLTRTDNIFAEFLLPSFIPTDRPAMTTLTTELRAKTDGLGINGRHGLNDDMISRALVLLPHNRAGAGVISFEIETGKDAGLYQCEALGRGATSDSPEPGWIRGLIGSTTIYYAPAEESNGATVPGIYDARNITSDNYEIALLDKPEDLKGEEDVLKRIRNWSDAPKPFFSAVYKHWYTKTNLAVPVDIAWARAYNTSGPGSGPDFFERRPAATSPEERSRQEIQLAHNPNYYYGPYGRSGWAVHTDRWEDPDRRRDPKYADRREISDFRFRDTSGCLKVRPGCLLKLNEFISEQKRFGRRVQLEIIETPFLDAVPQGPSRSK